MSELLEHWGKDGLEAHLRSVQSEYCRRARVICRAADQHLKGLATWEQPLAGMFLWVEVCVEGLSDLQDTLELLKEKKVVVVPGESASFDSTIPPADFFHCGLAAVFP